MNNTERILLVTIFIVSIGSIGIIAVMSVEIKNLYEELYVQEERLTLCQESVELCTNMYNEVVRP